MPTYAMHCPCGYADDLRQSILKPLPSRCPACKRASLTQNYAASRSNPIIDYVDPKSFGLQAEVNSRRLCAEERAARLGNPPPPPPKPKVDFGAVARTVEKLSNG